MKNIYSYRREEQKYTTPIFLPSSIVIYKYKINQLINMISSSYTCYKFLLMLHHPISFLFSSIFIHFYIRKNVSFEIKQL